MNQNHKCNNNTSSNHGSHGNKSQDETHNKKTHNNRNTSKTGKKSNKNMEDPLLHKTYQDQTMDGQSNQHKEH